MGGATEGRSGAGGNLIIKGDRLIHYQTTITERYGEKIILNYTRYSLVTGNIQKAIKELVPEEKIITVHHGQAFARQRLYRPQSSKL